MAANIGLDRHKRNSWTLHRAVLTVFLIALTGPLGCSARSARAAATDGWTEYVYPVAALVAEGKQGEP